ncbi:hypothetical protein CRUP_006395 [Coryphaenoides rupestris]|nr:hypothetical protein CRUP_006395 [Coryphaenoides rupestris]
MVLNPVISKLSGKLVVLASSSPRRLEILTNVGLRFEVVPSWFKETLDKRLFKAPHEYAVETARQKALEVARRMPFKHLKTPDIVIGADTIVTVGGLILEKPVDKQDAYRMLSRLSGKEHSVCTGVAIVLCHQRDNEEIDYQTIDFYEETKVKFADLSESMLWEYIDSGEPMDKAGGYGIQALGGMLVEYIHGDFLNVVGFPLNRFCKQLDLIYNHKPVLCDTERLGSNGSPTTSSLPSGPAPSNPHHADSPLQNGPPPSASPAPKVKRREGQSTPDDGSWTLVNSLSICSEGQENSSAGGSGSAVPPVASRGQHMNLPYVIENEHTDDLKQIIELMDGFKASKMRVFDLLQNRPGLGGAEVARALEASLRGTECLLEACVALGLLERTQGEHQDAVYQNSCLVQRYLLSDSATSLLGYLEHCDELVWPLFSHLEDAVREGTNQHAKVSGQTTSNTTNTTSNTTTTTTSTTDNNMFQNLYSRDAQKLRFMRAMHSIAGVAGPAVAAAFDLSRFKTACDLGGCTGSMAYALAKAYPGLSVTVFDLPSVVEASGAFSPPDADHRLPKADLYILARILHDWTDEKSLNMLTQTLGRERTGSQYTQLLHQHGFGNIRVAHTWNFLDVVLAVKN